MVDRVNRSTVARRLRRKQSQWSLEVYDLLTSEKTREELTGESFLVTYIDAGRTLRKDN